MTSPDWSDEHISLANRFTAQVVVAWLALVASNALFAPTGTFGFVFVGALTLGATWLLVHSLFTHVDGLVRTRLEEADEAATESGDDGAATAAESD